MYMYLHVHVHVYTYMCNIQYIHAYIYKAGLLRGETQSMGEKYFPCGGHASQGLGLRKLCWNNFEHNA